MADVQTSNEGERHGWSVAEFCFSRWLECECGFTARCDDDRTEHEAEWAVSR